MAAKDLNPRYAAGLGVLKWAARVGALGAMLVLVAGCPPGSELAGLWLGEDTKLSLGDTEYRMAVLGEGQWLWWVGTYSLDPSETPREIDVQFTAMDVDEERLTQDELGTLYERYGVETTAELERALEARMVEIDPNWFEKKSLGIYELEGDRLALHLFPPGRSRPVTLEDEAEIYYRECAGTARAR